MTDQKPVTDVRARKLPTAPAIKLQGGSVIRCIRLFGDKILITQISSRKSSTLSRPTSSMNCSMEFVSGASRVSSELSVICRTHHRTVSRLQSRNQLRKLSHARIAERKAERLPPETQVGAWTARPNCRHVSSGEAGRQFVSSVLFAVFSLTDFPSQSAQTSDADTVSAAVSPSTRLPVQDSANTLRDMEPNHPAPATCRGLAQAHCAPGMIDTPKAGAHTPKPHPKRVEATIRERAPSEPL